MTKDEFAKCLRNKGFNAENVNGCVLVFVPEITKKVQKEVNKIAKESGFVGSYGWKKVQINDET